MIRLQERKTTFFINYVRPFSWQVNPVDLFLVNDLGNISAKTLTSVGQCGIA